MMAETTVKGSQFNQPLLEFSGSCAGCAETSYARLITQLFGERMYHFQRHRLFVHLGRPGCNFPVHRATSQSGHGPAWANSLFEDNAEHGFGMYLGQKTIRDSLADKTRALIAVELRAARPEGRCAGMAGHYGGRQAELCRRR